MNHMYRRDRPAEEDTTVMTVKPMDSQDSKMLVEHKSDKLHVPEKPHDEAVWWGYQIDGSSGRGIMLRRNSGGDVPAPERTPLMTLREWAVGI